MAHTPKFAFANVSASTTDSEIVAAVAGKSIRVLQYKIVVGATATNTTFNSKGSGAGSAIDALQANGANGGAVAPYSPYGWFVTTPGQSLTITTGSGATAGVTVAYDLV